MNNFLRDISKVFQLTSILRQLTTFFITIFIANWISSISEIGLFEIYFLLAAALVAFVANGINQTFLSEVSGQKFIDQNAYKYYSVLWVLSLFLVVCLYFIQDLFFDLLVYKKNDFLIASSFLFFLFLYIPIFFVEPFLLANKSAKALLYYSFFSNITTIISFVFPLYYHYDITDCFVVYSIFLILRHSYLIIKINWKYFQYSIPSKVMILCLPLILYASLGQFAKIFDQLLVGWYTNGDLALFAIFRYGAKEIPFIPLLSSSFSTSMIPLIKSQTHLFDFNIFKKRISSLYFIIFSTTIIFMITSDYWFPLIFSEKFNASIILFDIYMLLVISRALFPQTILLSFGHRNALVVISIIEIVINVILSLLFLPFGLVGIVWATIIAFTIEKIILCVYLQYKEKISFFEYTPSIELAIYILSISGTFVLKYYI